MDSSPEAARPSAAKKSRTPRHAAPLRSEQDVASARKTPSAKSGSGAKAHDKGKDRDDASDGASADSRQRKNRQDARLAQGIEDEDVEVLEDARRQAREEAEEREEHKGRSGRQHMTYVLPPKDSHRVENLRSWRVVEKGTKGAAATSKLCQYIRITGQFGADAQTASAPQSRPDVAQAVQTATLSTAGGLLTGTSHGNTDSYQAAAENWVLEHFSNVVESDPDSDIAKYVQEIRRWERVGKLKPEEDDEEIMREAAVPLIPMPENLCLTLFTACLTPKSQKVGGGKVPGLARERKESDMGRQIGFPGLNHFDQAITQMHRLVGLESPTERPIVDQYRLHARKKHKTKHHQYICFDSDMPLIYEAVMKHERWSQVEKIRNWALILYTAYHGHRKIEMGTYCPDITDLKAPTDAGNWEQKAPFFGEPKHLEITSRVWKGHAEDMDERPLILWRNPSDARFCVGDFVLIHSIVYLE